VTATREEDVRALVLQAAVQDPDAWEALYRRSYPRLFAYARRRLPSDELVEDAVSETMLRAIGRIGAFEWKGAGFDAWLYGILRNVLLEKHRDRARVTPDPFVDGPSVPGPLEALVRDDQLRLVRCAFEQLDPDEQEVLELRFTGGMSADQIATVLDRKAGTVRMAQSRALTRLRAIFGELDR